MLPVTPGIRGRRALPARRLARLGATPHFHHGLLVRWDRSGGKGREVLQRGRFTRVIPNDLDRSRRSLMDSVMRAAIGGQLGAAINTLREAIEQCPDTLWDDRSDGAPFWQIAYHTLFCLDMYSSPSLKAFTPTTFHVKDAQFLAGDYPWLDPPRTIGVPTFVFNKADVLRYLQQCREHCVARWKGCRHSARQSGAD